MIPSLWGGPPAYCFPCDRSILFSCETGSASIGDPVCLFCVPSLGPAFQLKGCKLGRKIKEGGEGPFQGQLFAAAFES